MNCGSAIRSFTAPLLRRPPVLRALAGCCATRASRQGCPKLGTIRPLSPVSDVFLADDLSGALDAAAAFHHAGRRVIIPLSLAAWPKVTGSDVVGLTTETRNASPQAAGAVVARVLAEARARGSRVLYTKIDS